MNSLPVAVFFCALFMNNVEAWRKVENVALRGRAAQSSILGGPHAAGAYVAHAMNVVDGNRDPDLFRGSCTHTHNDMSPWWKVDLLKPYKIQRITVTNTITFPARMNGAEILVGNSPENNGNNNPRCATIYSLGSGATQTYECHDMEGRYVNLIIRGRQEFLTPCEVEVMAYADDPHPDHAG